MKVDKENPSISINKLLRGAIPLHQDQPTRPWSLQKLQNFENGFKIAQNKTVVISQQQCQIENLGNAWKTF